MRQKSNNLAVIDPRLEICVPHPTVLNKSPNYYKSTQCYCRKWEIFMSEIVFPTELSENSVLPFHIPLSHNPVITSTQLHVVYEARGATFSLNKSKISLPCHSSTMNNCNGSMKITKEEHNLHNNGSCFWSKSSLAWVSFK